MKEKLFILWGDLEERKAKAIAEGNSVNHHSWGPVSSVPFICCIKEYGVKCSHNSDADDEMVVNHDFGCSHEDCFGWERRFAMFQTTINASWWPPAVWLFAWEILSYIRGNLHLPFLCSFLVYAKEPPMPVSYVFFLTEYHMYCHRLFHFERPSAMWPCMYYIR